MTDTADRFTSKYRQRTTTPSGTRDRRRVFESSNNDETKNSVSVSGTAGRYRSTGDRGDRGEKTESVSISSRINKLYVNDDNNDDDKDQSSTPTTTDKNEDDDGEESTSRTRSHKKAVGGASANSGRKRRDRKNLREKRRSTGVVIMPGQPVIFKYFLYLQLNQLKHIELVFYVF